MLRCRYAGVVECRYAKIKHDCSASLELRRLAACTVHYACTATASDVHLQSHDGQNLYGVHIANLMTAGEHDSTSHFIH